MVAFALSEASRVMHELDPRRTRWPTLGEGRQGPADITPGKLAERCNELMKRRRPGHTLMFVVDEVGQFVARDVQKMLDLQAVVQSLGRWAAARLARRDVAGEARRARQRPRRQAGRARPADGPLPAPGPPRAVRHLRGHEPARALEERRRPGDAPGALRRAPRPAHRPHRLTADIKLRSSRARPSSTSTRCCRTRST